MRTFAAVTALACVAATLAACAPTRPGLYASNAQAFSESRAIRLETTHEHHRLQVDIDLPVAEVSIDRRPGVAEIAIDYQAHAATRELLEGVALTATLEENQLTIRSVGPERTGTREWYIARVDVFVPDAERLLVRTASGRILVAGVGPQRAETFLDAEPHRLISASGDVSALDLAGPITVRTTSGKVSITRGIGDAIIDAASGDVDIADRDGTINVVSASGDVELVRVRKPFTINTISGDVDITLAQPFKGLVRTNTHTGEVQAVRTTDDPNRATSSVTTTTGDITIAD
ncbi:MAG: DUF4097 family beta strand repeat-containing protein [Planctomycetota bacterium]